MLPAKRRFRSQQVALCIICILLAGCSTAVPVGLGVNDEPVEIPPHCDLTMYPRVKEPKLDETKDTKSLDAVKDRLALKQAYRTESARRQACYDELKEVLGELSKPSS